MKIDMRESFLISWGLIAAVIGYSLYIKSAKPVLYFGGAVLALFIIQRIYMKTRPAPKIDETRIVRPPGLG